MLQPAMTTLGIVDTNPMICEGFGVVMHRLTNNFKVIFKAYNFEDLKAQTITDIELPSIMLLTPSNPISNCLESATLLQENHPKMRVTAFSDNYPEGSKYQLAKAGCIGFLYKDDKMDVWEKAFLDIVNHGTFVNSRSDLIKVLRTPFVDEKPTGIDLIIIQLICTDKTYVEIGLIVNLNHKTVEDHVFKLCDKLHVHNRHGLMCMAFRRKWVDLEIQPES